jgi:RNase P subunit RPR2
MLDITLTMAARIPFTCVQCGKQAKWSYGQLRGADYKKLACKKCGRVPSEVEIRLALSNLFDPQPNFLPSKRRRYWAA